MSRIFRADFSRLSEILSHIKGELITSGCGKETVNTAHIICDEFITNIIRYAYAPDIFHIRDMNGKNIENPVEVSFQTESGRVSIEISDWGKPFDPLKYGGDSSPGRAHGGFGIRLARDLADSITYRRENRRNILTVSINNRD